MGVLSADLTHSHIGPVDVKLRPTNECDCEVETNDISDECAKLLKQSMTLFKLSCKLLENVGVFSSDIRGHNLVESGRINIGSDGSVSVEQAFVLPQTPPKGKKRKKKKQPVKQEDAKSSQNSDVPEAQKEKKREPRGYMVSLTALLPNVARHAISHNRRKRCFKIS